jgi:ATP-dependent Clp protease ATP-binding subunit ClpA
MAKLLNVDPNSIGVMADMEPHPVPFFPPDVAAMLLAKIDESSPHSDPIPMSTDMPTSSELTQVLNAAQDLRRQFQSAKVYPLHLLASALADPSSKASQVLRDAGISSEKVLEALPKD